MRRGLALTACLLGLSAAAGPGASAQRVMSRDERGHTIMLPAPPKRIVSTAPGITEILFALGVGNRIVGATAFCDYPAAARSIPRVGDSTISVEKIVALRPDLVVSSGSANRKAIDALAHMPSFRAPVFVVDPNSFGGLYASIGAIGRIVGKPAEATALLKPVKARVGAVTHAASAQPNKPRVLVVIQPEPLWVVGTDTFIDELVRCAGGLNIGAATGSGYHTIPVERALAARPDVILVGQEGLAKLRATALWHATPAYRSGRIYAFDPSVAARPGPRLVDALEQIARLLHPGIKFDRK